MAVARGGARARAVPCTRAGCVVPILHAKRREAPRVVNFCGALRAPSRAAAASAHAATMEGSTTLRLRAMDDASMARHAPLLVTACSLRPLCFSTPCCATPARRTPRACICCRAPLGCVARAARRRATRPLAFALTASHVVFGGSGCASDARPVCAAPRSAPAPRRCRSTSTRATRTRPWMALACRKPRSGGACFAASRTRSQMATKARAGASGGAQQRVPRC